QRAAAWLSAAEGLGLLLHLLHPIVPFVTEEIWASLHEILPDGADARPELLMTARWPSGGARDDGAEAEVAALIDMIRGVRNLRTESGSRASAWLPLTVVPGDAATHDALDRGRDYLSALAHVRPIELRDPGDDHGRPDR